MRIPSRRRALAAAVLTPVLLIGATACGGDDTEPASADATTSTPDAEESPSDEPTDSETEPVDSSEEVDGDEVSDPEALFARMLEAMQDARTSTVSMDMGVGTAQGQMSYGTGAPEMALTMDLGQAGLGTMEMRLVGGKVYMNIPGVTPVGKFFEISGQGAGMGDLVDEFSNMTPDASIELMAQALERMVLVGEEKIGSEDTQRYRLTVNTADSQALLGQTETQGLPALPETIDYDMWVTQDDLIRRISMDIEGVGVQLDYTDWGKPVDIKAPAPRDIVQAPPGM